MPKRIQLRRTKGWTKPPNTVVVCRPTKWGNPMKVGDWLNGKQCDRGDAAEWYRRHVTADSQMGRAAKTELRGKNLACWCPLDQPCHADVLLEIANGS